MKRALGLLASALAVTGCGGTTGGARFTFEATAVGTPAAADFDNGVGFHVALTRARVHVGALYLNGALPSSGSQSTSCILPTTYVGQVLGGAEVDALSAAPQPFVETGEAISISARAAEVWLSGGDVNAVEDSTAILDVAGTATRGAETYPFEAVFTIGGNRLVPSPDPAYPSLNPICKQRIVSPIPVDFTPEPGGALQLQVDPRGWFLSVDFSAVSKVSDAPLLYRFDDAPVTSADVALYGGLRSRLGVYLVGWQ